MRCFGQPENFFQNRRAWFWGGRKFYFLRCFELGNFILFRGDLVLRKSSPHVFGEGGRRVAPSPIKVVLRCKRMLSALQITQNRKDPIITARAIHILVRSPEISPKYHQARKIFPWDQARRKNNFRIAEPGFGRSEKYFFRGKISSLVLSSFFLVIFQHCALKCGLLGL